MKGEISYRGYRIRSDMGAFYADRTRGLTSMDQLRHHASLEQAVAHIDKLEDKDGWWEKHGTVRLFHDESVDDLYMAFRRRLKEEGWLGEGIK